MALAKKDPTLHGLTMNQDGPTVIKVAHAPVNSAGKAEATRLSFLDSMTATLAPRGNGNDNRDPFAKGEANPQDLARESGVSYPILIDSLMAYVADGSVHSLSAWKDEQVIAAKGKGTIASLKAQMGIVVNHLVSKGLIATRKGKGGGVVLL